MAAHPTISFNLADLFECVADHIPDRTAIVCGSRRLTYRDLEERANRLAHRLAEAGIGPGDHVGLFLFNGTEFIEGMLAAYKIRAVPVNVNYRYVGAELEHLFRDADLVALVHHRELAPRLDGVLDRVTPMRCVLVVGDASGAAAGDDAVDYDEALATASPDRDFAPRSADDLYVLYTGGTTGLPKGVMWRHEDIFFAMLGSGITITDPAEIGPHAVRGGAAPPALREGGSAAAPADPVVGVSLSLGPMMHASGQWAAFVAMMNGGTLVVAADRQFDPDRTWRLVERERVTHLTVIGDAVARPLLAALDAPGGYDLSSLATLGSGGSILSPDVKRHLLARIPSLTAIVEAMGSSEAPVQGLTITTRDGVSSPGLRFSVDANTTVLDDDLRPVEPGSGVIGRLATRGHVPLGYYKDPAKSARTFVDVDGARWSLPGDMATIDADGTVRVLGRGSLCINTGGEKVYPEEVESAVKSHEAVADCLVVGVPDERWGQRVAAVVEPAAGHPAPTLDELDRHCRERVAGYKVPRQLHVVETIRRSPAGKGDYAWAKEVASGVGADALEQRVGRLEAGEHAHVDAEAV